MVVPPDGLGLLTGAVALGAVHGVEPGHGWPVAASYALGRSNKWLSGLAASLLIGVGHLISSIAMVAVFFYAKSYFELTQVNQPVGLDIFGASIVIGGPVSIVAGLLLIVLGVREYRHGHSHDHGATHSDDAKRHEPDHGHDHSGHTQHDHDHDHTHGYDHDHTHSDDNADGGIGMRVIGSIPFVGGHSHSGAGFDTAGDRGLFGIAWFAFVLGFAHEEEFEIIALCAGSPYCLELMSAYALTVIAGIVGLTMLLIAGYQRSEDRVQRLTPYLPIFSATVLIGMGIGFVIGLF